MIDIIILGATGSIGKQAISLIKDSQEYNLIGFTFDRNYKEALKILDEFPNVKAIGINDSKIASIIEERYKNRLSIFKGEKANIELINCYKGTFVLNALSGISGIEPSFEAIKNKSILALANKETIVVGGELFKKYCKQIKYVDAKKVFKLILGLIFRGQIIIDGLNSGKKIEKIINKICKEKNIENINQIETNLLIPSVDLNDGKIYFFTSFEKRQRYSDQIIYVNDINIGKAVRASCTYPGVFSPCEYNDTYLVDGGIRENVPWKGLKENGADKVFCVTFEEELKEKKKANIVDAIFDSLSILCHELSTYELHEADYLIKIKTKKVSLLDTSQIDYLYNEGYNQAKKFLKETNIKL